MKSGPWLLCVLTEAASAALAFAELTVGGVGGLPWAPVTAACQLAGGVQPSTVLSVLLLQAASELCRIIQCKQQSRFRCFFFLIAAALKIG